MPTMILNNNVIKGLIMNGRPVTAIMNGKVIWPVSVGNDRLAEGLATSNMNDNSSSSFSQSPDSIFPE